MLTGKLTFHDVLDEQFITFYFVYTNQLFQADYAVHLEVYTAAFVTEHLSAERRGMVHSTDDEIPEGSGEIIVRRQQWQEEP